MSNAYLPGREAPINPDPQPHPVLHTSPQHEATGSEEVLYLGMGCFWGAERLFWQLPGVVSTAVGYMGGLTPNPTYREVCTGRTGHAEVVRIVFDPARVSCEEVLRVFWENHDVTQGMAQGNDVGTQYRSLVIATSPLQATIASNGAAEIQSQLLRSTGKWVTTQLLQIGDVPDQRQLVFYLAEEEHQAYLHKNPGGYCNHGPTGLVCPISGLRD